LAASPRAEPIRLQRSCSQRLYPGTFCVVMRWTHVRSGAAWIDSPGRGDYVRAMPPSAGRLTSSLAVAACALALAAPAAAAPGDLDETFSKDGRTVTEMTGDLVNLDSYASATV